MFITQNEVRSLFTRAPQPIDRLFLQPPELEDEEGISYSAEMKDFLKQAYVSFSMPLHDAV